MMKRYSTFAIVTLALATSHCSDQQFSSGAKQPAKVAPSAPPLAGGTEGSGAPNGQGGPGSTDVIGQGRPPGVDGSGMGATPIDGPTPAGPKDPKNLPSIEIKDGSLTLNRAITRIEVITTLDHTTDLVVSPTEIYFTHKHLGFPKVTTLKMYDDKGALIDTQNWLPQFRVGQGSNCPRADYLQNPGDCTSDRIKLAAGHALKGNLTKKKARGHLAISVSPQANGKSTVTTSAWDCGRDCGSPAPNAPKSISGADGYHWITE